MAAYLHKKFKKFASSEQPPRGGHDETCAAASGGALKHSVGNMVSSAKDDAASRRLSSSSEERMTPPEFDTSMAKTYYCEVCRFAFRLKSNLIKHTSSRSHYLKLEQGLESSEATILAELGDGAAEEELSAKAVVALPSDPGPSLQHPQHRRLREENPRDRNGAVHGQPRTIEELGGCELFLQRPEPSYQLILEPPRHSRDLPPQLVKQGHIEEQRRLYSAEEVRRQDTRQEEPRAVNGAHIPLYYPSARHALVPLEKNERLRHAEQQHQEVKLLLPQQSAGDNQRQRLQQLDGSQYPTQPKTQFRSSDHERPSRQQPPGRSAHHQQQQQQASDLSFRLAFPPAAVYPSGQYSPRPPSHHFSRASPTASGAVVSSPSPLSRSSPFDSAAATGHPVNIADRSGSHRYRNNSFSSHHHHGPLVASLPSHPEAQLSPTYVRSGAARYSQAASALSHPLSAVAMPKRPVGHASVHPPPAVSLGPSGLDHSGPRQSFVAPPPSQNPLSGRSFDAGVSIPHQQQHHVNNSSSRVGAAAGAAATQMSRPSQTATTLGSSSDGSKLTVAAAASVESKVSLPPATSASSLLLGSGINPISLEQRINKVISQNQAIVETLDPFWKGRYMRQSSREGDNSESGGSGGRGRGRRYSSTLSAASSSSTAAAAAVATSSMSSSNYSEAAPGASHSEARSAGLSSRSTRGGSDSFHPHGNAASSGGSGLLLLPANLANNTAASTAPLLLAMPPRPDSNLPLNLATTDPANRKRKSPPEHQHQAPPTNALADAQSVREVWLNSQKKNISQLEDLASSIEASLRSSENPFHPDNPEGSIIKDLLLKTRSGLLALPKEVADSRGWSLAVLEAQRPLGTAENSRLPPNGHEVEKSVSSLEVIPMPKNILAGNNSGTGSVSGSGQKHSTSAESSYQCDQCQVTFKSLESIEIHQTHFCKHAKYPLETVLQRPNSTVLPRPGPADRRHSETAGDEPSPKRSRSESYPSPVVVANPPPSSQHQQHFTQQQQAGRQQPHIGLLQIAPAYSFSESNSSALQHVPASAAVSNSNRTASHLGIPTPSLSGVLTGIKPPPLFSLPGARTEPIPSSSSSSSPAVEEKPVAYVAGMPGPYSQSQPQGAALPAASLVTASSSLQPSTRTSQTSSSEQIFVKLPVGAGQHSPGGERRLSSSSSSATSPRGVKKAATRAVKAEFSAEEMGSVSIPVLERPKSLLIPAMDLSKRNALALTLDSPETPRPKKPYVLHYQNGTAYTYLGLKCSTRVFFCSIHKAQPNYVELEANSRVSMYSNWKVVSEDCHPSRLSPKEGMSCYNSSYHDSTKGIYTVARPARCPMITTHSSWRHKKRDVGARGTRDTRPEDDQQRSRRTVEGGYKSNDDNYTYIRGRGRGKYICDSCGIRCKKPSMLKKHIRTHTNVRPYTCKYCNFSFKTKGNLTKHMKSKAHSKKCVELGIVPVPTSADDSSSDDPKSSDLIVAGDSDTDDGDDGDDLDDDEEDEDDRMDDFGSEERSDRNSEPGSGYDESSSMLGLAPWGPRFSTCPLVSSGLERSCERVVERSCVMTQLGEHEQVYRITQLAKERGGGTPALDAPPLPSPYYYTPAESLVGGERRPATLSTGAETTTTTTIWSLARMTSSLQPGQVGSGDRQQQQQGSGGRSDLELTRHEGREQPLPSARESAADLSGPGPSQTDSVWRAANGPPLVVEDGLKHYLQERAAFKALQQQRYESRDYSTRLLGAESQAPFLQLPHFNQSSDQVTVKEEIVEEEQQQQNQQQQQQQEREKKEVMPRREEVKREEAFSSSSKKEESRKEYIHNFAIQQTDSIPQNVTMNVKDIPNITPGQSQPPPPEFNIPHISKADSPVRRLDAAGPKGRLPAAEVGSTAQKGGVDASRSTESPASNSSTDEDAKGVLSKPQEIFQINEEGKSVCGICQKVFSKPSQLRLHVNIHYFERPFRCDSCAVSFRTKGHLQKHKRSVGHFNKVNINATFGTPSTDNPRPFKCSDCMIAFRIHGHLAKHLRSKMHIMKLECIGKLPIGMYAEMERLGTNLNEIDTTDCENSLESLQQMAVKLYEKDPSKLTAADETLPAVSTGSDISEDEDSNLSNVVSYIKEEPQEPQGSGPEVSRLNYPDHEQRSPEDSTPRVAPHTTPVCPPQSTAGVPAQSSGVPSQISAGFPLQSSGRFPPQSSGGFPPQHSGGFPPHSTGGLSLQHSAAFPPHSTGGLSLQHSAVFPPQSSTALPQQSAAGFPHQAPVGGFLHQDLGSDAERARASSPTSSCNPAPYSQDCQYFTCQICSLQLPDQYAFQQHLTSHVKPRPYICRHCDAGFTSIRQLESHAALHQQC